ncbi:hypothetical protein [Actinomadura decatromicini]|uniref:hypothetical protein n=1 Tax=Actinomadura decatromicini TaxID=2604572 RepID=UPI001652BC79|nr:hypothetical protein [Actinomadura decatromicini]
MPTGGEPDVPSSWTVREPSETAFSEPSTWEGSGEEPPAALPDSAPSVPAPRGGEPPYGSPGGSSWEPGADPLSKEPSAGRHAPREDEPFLPSKGLSVEPPSVTRPDVTTPQWAPAEAAVRPGPMADPGRRMELADAFVAEFVGSTTWRATLAVLEGAFPGLGMAAKLSGRTDELWRTMDALDRKSAAGIGVPAWLDDAGMVFDLSAHLGTRPSRTSPKGPPRASRPYAGAFVIDTLDPLRYHRAVGGPRAPRPLPGEGEGLVPNAAEDDDSGVVIVAHLASAGVRVLDSAVLWRYAGRVVTGTLHEPARPDTRARTRRALRALRRVVFVDPELGLGLCLQVDAARVPRCLLAFGVDRAGGGAPRFVRP